MEITKQEFKVLIISSFRYALGRRSAVVSETVEMLIKYWDSLEPFFKEQMKRDIEHAIEAGIAGDLCDINEWKVVWRKIDNESE